MLDATRYVNSLLFRLEMKVISPEHFRGALDALLNLNLITETEYFNLQLKAKSKEGI